MATIPAPAPIEETPTWHVLSGEGVAKELHVEPERGLTSAEAGERLRRYGPNKFAEAKPEPRWRAFVRQYDDPMQIVLLVAGVIS
ncbi:MAG TPA: cation-transporting P-type ATPase, partial [Baekduia sp.]|nr:cation-transporting P-type ATPase [Baekduia sp.]